MAPRALRSRPGITSIATGGAAMSASSPAPAGLSGNGEAVACASAMGAVAPTAVCATQIATRFMSHSRHRDGAGLPLAGTASVGLISRARLVRFAPLQGALCKSLLAKHNDH